MHCVVVGLLFHSFCVLAGKLEELHEQILKEGEGGGGEEGVSAQVTTSYTEVILLSSRLTVQDTIT